MLEQQNLALIAEAQLFGKRIMQRRRRQRESERSQDAMVRDLSELRIGAPVVHIDNGVGRYLGLQSIDAGGQANEFLTLEYADGAKLYVPVSNLHLISRYSGADDDTAPLHKLGNERWSQAKQKALEKIRDTAAELLDIYARREAREGFRFSAPDEAYSAFCAGFPFEETPDQQAAIDAVIRGHDRRPPHGPAGVWRCRLRQNRGGHARGLPRDLFGQAGGGAGAHHPLSPAALRVVSRPVLGYPGAGRAAQPLPHRQADPCCPGAP